MTGPVAAATESRAAAAATSLDTLQTSVAVHPSGIIFENWIPEDDDTQSFVHSGWAPTRRKIRDSLIRTAQTPERIMRFQECGRDAWVYQSTTDQEKFKVITNHCGDRFCLVCGGLRAWKVRAALQNLMAGRTLSFVTLTLSGKKQGLSEQLDRLYRHFRALRSQEIWERCVTGGAAFLEVKWNDKSRRWHPHLHLILDARFMSQSELSNIWRAITHDSYIVDIRRVRENAHAASYVTKYCTKPLNHSFANSPDLLDEAVIAMKGRRLCFCFGTWYGTSLSEVEDNELFDAEANDATWTSVAKLSDIIERARAGDAIAIGVLGRLQHPKESRPLHDTS